MSVDYEKEARGLIGGGVIFQAPMRRFTSMRVGGPADCLLFPRDLEELRKIVRHARRRSIPLLALGKGTNLIVGDQGVAGWVVSLNRGMKSIRSEGEVIEAEAGVSLRRLVYYSVQKGLSGFEPFAGIPGTVGGGLAMNAGAWGAELKDKVLSVTFMDENGELIERSRSRLRFRYRELIFPASWIIVQGRFQLRRGKREEILERVDRYLEQRKRKQPLDYPSAGSIFKNPREGPAAKWIEEAGLKGLRMGQAMVSERHANFIVNLGKAKAEEVIRLMETVEQEVCQKEGIRLEREVRVVGR